MITDFHTHAMPDGLAPRALSTLRAGIREVSGIEIEPATDFTYAGLIRAAEAAGADRSVVLPVATKPGQAEKINASARETEKKAKGSVVVFAAVHPADGDFENLMPRLADSGFLGIKLHPEFQSEYFDSDRMIRLLKAARDSDLTVVTHAGADIGIRPPVHGTPERLARALERVPGLRLVAAHLGGWMMWDAVAGFLCGLPLYFDTSFLSGFIEPSRLRDIIRSHGSRRVLFGSDSPWESPSRTLELLRSSGLSAGELEEITSANAEKILKRK
ncbi:MAG: amidohydrolase family protein [Clostridia bacterium]|nr:amidohydrolase family protein [Clostridia bacterium]